MMLATFTVVPGAATGNDQAATRRRIHDFWWGQGTGIWVHPSCQQIDLFGYVVGDPHPNNLVSFSVRTWNGRLVQIDDGEVIELVGPMSEAYRAWATLGPEFDDENPLGPPPSHSYSP